MMVTEVFVLKGERIEESRENLISRSFPNSMCHWVLLVWANQGCCDVWTCGTHEGECKCIL